MQTQPNLKQEPIVEEPSQQQSIQDPSTKKPITEPTKKSEKPTISDNTGQSPDAGSGNARSGGMIGEGEERNASGMANEL